MRTKLETEIKVGLFVTLGIVLVLTAILLLGGGQSIFSKKATFQSHFKKVDGLISGAKVIIDGVPVGTVDEVSFDRSLKSIKVDFSVTRDAADLIREDSTVEIATQGVLGDKYLSISSGSEDKKILPPGSEVQHRTSKDLTQFINRGDQLLGSLNHLAGSLDRVIQSFESNNRSETFFQGMAVTARNLAVATDKLSKELDRLQLSKGINSLNQILEKVNNGTGTIGALINDPGIYDEIKALMGGANRNRVIRNLVRQTIKKSDEVDKKTLVDPSTPRSGLAP